MIWTRRGVGYLALIAPLPVFLALAYGVPFFGVAGWSLTLPEPGLSNYERVFTDPIVLGVLLRTLRICAVVTIVTTAAAYALAYIWVQGSPRQRIFVEFCILVPFWISTLTRAFGWLVLLYNRGLVNTWLQDLGVTTEPLTLVRNEFGVIVGMTHFLIPFAVFPIASAMRHLDERVLLASRGLGAGRLRTFWSVFLPMTMPGILGAALIVFVFSLGFFITPAILGGGRSVMAAEFVYVQLFQTANWGLAAAISVVMVAIVAVLVTLLFRLTRVEKLMG
ncbi:ABC transporter permease [Rhodospirillaceae bacterium SYSU D60014]|uniref:ABC transporter permease n=1 Tax=Virgifigura deserti TaxID=2268457 RepID=UPI000E66A837